MSGPRRPLGQPAPWHIAACRSDDDIAEVARLFERYAASLEVDLTYQDFGGELARLPGDYRPPLGELLLARDRVGRAIGCVALRPLAPPWSGELKRLYIRPDARGTGLGRALAMAAIQAAERVGYAEIRLDSLPDMQAAIALYRSLGFQPIQPYGHSPIAGTVFLALRLTD